jgi:DNA-binding NtrC family response regulator
MIDYTILVVDDEHAQRETLAGFLVKKGYAVEKAGSGSDAIEAVTKHPIDLVLTDYRMPDTDGLTVLREVKAINPQVDVIIMTAYGSIESATEAMKSGAIDYLTKPINLDELELVIGKAQERSRLVSENRELRILLEEKFHFKGIVSVSSEMEAVLNTAARAAPSQATVLIRGESGTGKELIAKAIHFASNRRLMPFVTVNCAALSEHLLESELFGHEKGAFTGADRTRKGRFEYASGGTLFLDEIAEVPPPVQVKLLRILQERSFERVGGNQTINVDIRLIAATNRDLEGMLEQGTLRDDFYFRINVVSIVVPPLRERKSDIAVLVDHFIRKYADAHDRPVLGISREAMDALLKYQYPGNVRELENIVEQAVVLSRGETIATRDLPVNLRGLGSENAPADHPESSSFDARVAAFEKNLIRDALARAGGVQTKAAGLLGMSERHLRYKLKKYGMK